MSFFLDIDAHYMLSVEARALFGHLQGLYYQDREGYVFPPTMKAGAAFVFSGRFFSPILGGLSC